MLTTYTCDNDNDYTNATDATTKGRLCSNTTGAVAKGRLYVKDCSRGLLCGLGSYAS